jgi:hypothetical protein
MDSKIEINESTNDCNFSGTILQFGETVKAIYCAQKWKRAHPLSRQLHGSKSKYVQAVSTKNVAENHCFEIKLKF